MFDGDKIIGPTSMFEELNRDGIITLARLMKIPPKQFAKEMYDNEKANDEYKKDMVNELLNTLTSMMGEAFKQPKKKGKK